MLSSGLIFVDKSKLFKDKREMETIMLMLENL